jgi:FAD/FMN-containing dehydrogenase
MTSNNLPKEISEFFKGEVTVDQDVLEKYSRDASLFVVKPQVVAYPKDTADVENLVDYINKNRDKYENLSITGRAAGTDMSGGAINEGIILDFTKYFKKEDINVPELKATVGPGVFFRDFEKDTLPKNVSMPAYPASKSLAAIGGMVMNNCGGEKTLRYGQIRNFVNRLKMILTNGSEYSFRKLNLEELEEKKARQDFEGEIYRRTHDLLENNYDLIKSAKPKVSKNSSGYALWDVYDKEAGTFDLTQLFTGSQGTLGIMTEAELRLVELKESKKLVTLFFKDWADMPEVVKRLTVVGAESLETFDDTTLKLGIRFMPEIAKKVGKSFFGFAKQFLPEVLIGIRMLGLPKLIVLVQITEDDEEAVDRKVKEVVEAVSDLRVLHRVIEDEDEAEKYWVMRRESFSLLRNHVKTKKTAPFIDDFCVLPEKLPEFLPKMLKILDRYNIKVNIAGHAGSGNLHIIPLMDLKEKHERDKIKKVSDEVYDLIIEYGGTITAEHNDGIIRTPYVSKMFGDDVYGLFQQIKDIFDPNNIFNPGKKVGGTIEYMEEHIAKK